ncbi:MAG: hypothetical protein JNK05_13530 [Myxococcales bacterium]|nr:hypothetical protein [Myxococcales bacterium]
MTEADSVAIDSTIDSTIDAPSTTLTDGGRGCLRIYSTCVPRDDECCPHLTCRVLGGAAQCGPRSDCPSLFADCSDGGACCPGLVCMSRGADAGPQCAEPTCPRLGQPCNSSTQPCCPGFTCAGPFDNERCVER